MTPRGDRFVQWGRYLMAALLAAVVGWFAFIVHRPVPILDLFDLAVHEVGHLAFAVMPKMVMFIAGSAAQIAVPLALAWYFGIQRRDAAGGGFCLTWAGASMWDVSVYIADAPVRSLPLVGGGQHDWGFLLGPEGWDAMHLADDIAGFVEFSGAVLAVAGVLVAAVTGVQGLRRSRSIRSRTPSVTRIAGRPDPWVSAQDLPFVHGRTTE